MAWGFGTLVELAPGLARQTLPSALKSRLQLAPVSHHLSQAQQGTPQPSKTLELFGMVDSSRLCIIQGPDRINQTAVNSWLLNWWVKIFSPGIPLDSLSGESFLEWSNGSLSEEKKKKILPDYVFTVISFCTHIKIYSSLWRRTEQAVFLCA